MEIHAECATIVTSDVRLIAKHECAHDATGAALSS
jgi:hypothetical protein